MRFPLEVFDAVRAAFPAERPVWMRISATDWVPGGWDIEGTVALSKALKARGCAAIHVTTGGVSPAQAIKLGPGYQVPYAQRVKAEVGLPTIAVGLITEPEQAEAIIANGEADAVSLARAMLYDPRWPWHAAAKLGAPGRPRRKQYWRSQPREYKDLFDGREFRPALNRYPPLRIRDGMLPRRRGHRRAGRLRLRLQGQEAGAELRGEGAVGGRVPAPPVIEAEPGIRPRLAPPRQVQHPVRRPALVVQMRHQPALGGGMGDQAREVLLLDQPGHRHARAKHPPYHQVDRRGIHRALGDHMVGLVRHGVLQPVDQRAGDGLFSRSAVRPVRASRSAMASSMAGADCRTAISST